MRRSPVISALFVILASSLLARQQEFRFDKPNAQTVDAGRHESVMNSLKATGFRKVRFQSHAGGHDIYQPHISEALKGFVAEANKQNPTNKPSDSFESLFKKKP